MAEHPPMPSWFRHEPDKTATGYRWLDWLTDPYWRFTGWWQQRKFWRIMRVGDETWRGARDRFREDYAGLMDVPPPPPVDELLRRIEERRKDQPFMDRLATSVERNRDILDKLAEDD